MNSKASVQSKINLHSVHLRKKDRTYGGCESTIISCNHNRLNSADLLIIDVKARFNLLILNGITLKKKS